VSIPASILVADGSRDCADAVAMMLASNGMRAAVAYDAAAGMSLVARGHFDAAVTDLTLPGACGLSFAEELRRRCGRSIRLVAYTAWPASVARGAGADVTFDEVVSKASDPLELLRAVSAEAYGALLRSMQASVDDLRFDISLGHNLLDSAWTARTLARRRDLRGRVEKRLAAVERAAGRLLMADARAGIEAELEILRARIAQLRQGEIGPRPKPG
jgi:DNA-binding response OmpR family regulator